MVFKWGFVMLGVVGQVTDFHLSVSQKADLKQQKQFFHTLFHILITSGDFLPLQ